MINYIEKGVYLHDAMATQGVALVAVGDGTEFIHKGGNFTEAQVNTFIANYDSLPDAKKAAKQRVKTHAAGLVHEIYPFIDAELGEVSGFYDYTIDMYAGSMPLPTRLADMKGIRDTLEDKITEVNALTDWQDADSYDASVGW